MEGKLNIDLPTELLRLKQGEVSYSYEELSALRAEVENFNGFWEGQMKLSSEKAIEDSLEDNQ